MSDFTDIRTDYEDFWLRANNCWQPYFRNAHIALQAYSGRTWTDREIKNLRLEERLPEEYNIIRPQIQLFSGYARDNMKSTIVGPAEDSDQETADELSEVMKIVYEKGDTNANLLNGFDDALKTGSALVGMFLDFSNDPINGDLKFYKRGYSSFIVDPDWQKLDFSDASEVLLRDFVTREDAKALLPFVDPKLIDEMRTFSTDNKFTFLRNNQKFFKNKDILSYDQYYRKVTIKVKQIVNLDTGVSIPFDGDSEDTKFLEEKIQFAKSMGINAALIERNKQVVELNIILTGEPVYSGPDPVGLEDYPFVPIICHWEPELFNFGLKLQGVALGLVDTNRAFNKRMIRKQDAMDSVVDTGFMYKVGEVDVEDIRQSGSGKMIPVNSNLPFSEVIQPINQGAIPPGWQEETVFLQDLALRLAGINESLLGMDDGGNTQVSGRLAEVRAANGLRANRTIFDNFEKSMGYLGNKVVRAIQKKYSKGKITRMLGHEPTKEFFSEEFGRFDSVIKEAVLSQTQRDSLYFELLKLVEVFGPDKIPASFVISKIPMAGASELQEAIAQQEQQAQEQQKIAEEDRQRAIALENSITEQNIALSQERRARVFSDIGLAQERQSEIRQNISKANLDQAKTLVEIDKLKGENLVQLVQFLEFLRSKEIAEQDQDLKENFVIAQKIQNDSENQQPNEQAPVPQQSLGGANVQ